MTCIIAFRDKDNNVWLGGDKLGSDSRTKIITKDPKVFKNGDMYFGYTTSFYMGQLLKYNWEAPSRKMNETDDMYIFSSVRDSISKLFNDSKFGKDKDDNEPNYGLFIMVYKKRIFLVEPNMAFIEVDDIATCGSGQDVAMGTVMALNKFSNLPAQGIIEQSLEIVSSYIVSVSKECDIIRCD